MSSKHEFVGIANYLKMFEDKVFYVALKNNLIFTVMSVICQIGISLVIASVLEAKFMRKAQNFSSVYFIPSLLMVTVVGITFKMIYSPSIGLINPLLELAGIDTSNIDSAGKCRQRDLRDRSHVAVAIHWIYGDSLHSGDTEHTGGSVRSGGY